MINNCDDYDEDKYTLKYMDKYGIDNVRGGSFCEIQLSNENKITIKKMLIGTNDKCYICGKVGHFANECISNKNNNEKKQKMSDDEKGKEKIVLFSSDDDENEKKYMPKCDTNKKEQKMTDGEKAKIERSNKQYINFASKCKGNCQHCNNTRICYQYFDGEDEVYISCTFCYCGDDWCNDMFVKLVT